MSRQQLPVTGCGSPQRHLTGITPPQHKCDTGMPSLHAHPTAVRLLAFLLCQRHGRHNQMPRRLLHITKCFIACRSTFVAFSSALSPCRTLTTAEAAASRMTADAAACAASSGADRAFAICVNRGRQLVVSRSRGRRHKFEFCNVAGVSCRCCEGSSAMACCNSGHCAE